MSPEEKIPEEQDSDSRTETQLGATSGGETTDIDSHQPNIDATVDAELVTRPDASDLPQATIVEASFASPKAYLKPISPPPIVDNLDNIAANGGAVGAIVLGIWSFLGAFITNWSIINGILGVVLGLWGLTSRRRRMALIGILLCLISIFLSLIQVGELVKIYMNPVDENPF